MKDLTSPPSVAPFLLEKGRNNPIWTTWLDGLFRRVYPAIVVKGYLKADLVTANGLAPDQMADSTFSSVIYVTDATGGASTAFSDGTNWISTKTGAAV